MANVVIGYGIALVAQIIVFEWFRVDVTLGQDIVMGLIFTVVSLVRSYTLRRVFNLIHEKAYA